MDRLTTRRGSVRIAGLLLATGAVSATLGGCGPGDMDCIRTARRPCGSPCPSACRSRPDQTEPLAETSNEVESGSDADRPKLRYLNSQDLLELFKHWDTRVSHQELLFVPLAAAALPVAAVAWDRITLTVLMATALSSIGVYLYQLFLIRRIAVFQELIFNKLETEHFRDWASIMANPNRRLGVQRLRVIGLMSLAAVWIMMLAAKMDEDSPTPWWWLAIGAVGTGAVGLTIWQWKDTTPPT